MKQIYLLLICTILTNFIWSQNDSLPPSESTHTDTFSIPSKNHFDLLKAIQAFQDGNFEMAYKQLIHKELELNAEGYWCLGRLQETGRGGAVQDTADAIESYEKAIQITTNYCPAYASLAKLYIRQPNMVLKWQTKAALQDCSKGFTYVGYYHEQCGTYVVAAKCYQKAASLGDPQAWYNLAYLYQAGRGVVRNDLKAIECHQKAAQLGFQPSIEYLKNSGF
jgi:TPR repeat protein